LKTETPTNLATEGAAVVSVILIASLKLHQASALSSRKENPTKRTPFTKKKNYER
jgi:hypothetical protein